MKLNLVQNLLLLIITNLFNKTNCINSYIYLNDLLINEEIPIGSYVANLNTELELYNKTIQNALAYESVSNQQFTLLEDSKVLNGNSYFEIDQNENGKLITKRKIDREAMCLNRHCSEICESNQQKANFGSCRINLKVLMLPSYNILNFNVLIQDINDNAPMFRTSSIIQQISENVPIGYKIPIDLAFDPDIGRNRIQFYEITDPDSDLVQQTFKLTHNLNESHLHLVVAAELDREQISKYNFKITANDNGTPPLKTSLKVTIEITDINDNNPIFEKDYYKFSVSENTMVDSVIGWVKATDLDYPSLNGIVKYKFSDNSGSSSNNNVLQSFIKKFDLNESSGVIKLKSALDYENEKNYILTVEARDAAIGSLPSYATLEINVIDTNDNQPEISVSFLSSLSINKSMNLVYLPENTKANKFLAHVNINDKDSAENGRFDWMILVNNQMLTNSTNYAESNLNSVLKLIRLNNNSFTLNIGNTNLLDRERVLSHSVSIISWDYGQPKINKTSFNFTIILTDVNDNAPQFEKPRYEVSIFENNEPFQELIKIKANDADSLGPNSNVTYSFKEKIINDYLFIDPDGVIMTKASFDREKIEKFIFNVMASDQGEPSLTATTNIVLNILDLNDNKPNIIFNTSFFHRFFKLDETKDVKRNGLVLKNTVDSTLYIRIGENLSINSRLIDFRATDKDSNENAKVEFYFNETLSVLNQLPFRLNTDGQLTLVRSLNKQTKNIYELFIVCRDFGTNPSRLSSILQLTIEIVDSNEYCIKLKEETQTIKTKFLNRDSKIDLSNDNLFTIDYVLKNDDQNNKNILSFELNTHKDLFDIFPMILNKEKANVLSYRLEIKFKQTMSKYNISRLLLGKYTIRIKLIDNYNPTCNNLEQFTLIIGNNFVNEKELVHYLDNYKTLKKQNKFDNELFLNEDVNKEDVHQSNEEISNELNEETTDLEDDNSTTKFSFFNNKIKYLVKPATFMDSDYVLLFILIVVILIIGIFLAFIGIICVFSKFKKKDKKKSAQSKTTNDVDDLADTNKFILTSSDTNNRLKTYHSSTINNKTHYNLTLDKNLTANRALIYRNCDEEDFSIAPAIDYRTRQYSLSNKKSLYEQMQNQQPHTRYIYSSSLINNEQTVTSYDDSSNSNPESLIDTTTIDDEYEINTSNQKLKNYKTQIRNEQSSNSSTSSSAYSSISNSENQDNLSNENKVSNFLSFKNTRKSFNQASFNL